MAPGVLVVFLLLLVPSQVAGFTSAVFPQVATLQRTAPSKTNGVDLPLPDFRELFERIQQVSPLARTVIAQDNTLPGARGFASVDDSWPKDMKWKLVESNNNNRNNVIRTIEKIDFFNKVNAPLVRLRASMNGPCVGEYFANFMTDLEERQKWDSEIEQVYELLPIHDLDAANVEMGFGRYGDCSRLGVGYCQTKSNFVVTSREQLTLCGIQDFKDGSCIIWGVELEDWHNHMLPAGDRRTRARSHIFSTTLCPTSDSTFDVEYVIQLDVGGKIPTWATAPIVIETIKKLFRTADKYFQGKDGALEAFLRNKETEDMANRHSLLMTP